MYDVLLGVLAVLGGVLGGAAAKGAISGYTKYQSRRREQRFLRYVRINLPEAKVIELISVGPGDKQVIENIERRLRDASRHL